MTILIIHNVFTVRLGINCRNSSLLFKGFTAKIRLKRHAGKAFRSAQCVCASEIPVRLTLLTAFR